MGKTGPVEYEKTIMVKLTGPDKATITVSRNCNVKPTQSSVTIQVENNTYQPQNENKIDSITIIKNSTLDVTKQLLNNLGKLYTYRSALKTLTNTEKDETQLVRINTLIAQLDSTLKYSKKFVSQCSLLLKAQ